MITQIISLIIWLLVIGILYWLVLYVIQAIPIPDPPARFIKIALTILVVLFIVMLILQMFGIYSGVGVPKLAPA